MKILSKDNIPNFAVLNVVNWLGDSIGKSRYEIFFALGFLSCMLNMKKDVFQNHLKNCLLCDYNN